jgi:hypothetical protein
MKYSSDASLWSVEDGCRHKECSPSKYPTIKHSPQEKLKIHIEKIVSPVANDLLGSKLHRSCPVLHSLFYGSVPKRAVFMCLIPRPPRRLPTPKPDLVTAAGMMIMDHHCTQGSASFMKARQVMRRSVFAS